MKTQKESLYSELYRIRRFEETVLENFSRGVFSGTTHTYLGQEANAVGVLSHLNEGDIVFSNHRCHGHFITYGGDMRALFAELMGKPTGVCNGRGGSQHLQWRNFYSNGIQGGITPIAIGMALAEKRKNTGALSVVFLGDGTMGQGIVYETLNMASLWDVPTLFVVENNHIAQTTPIATALAGELQKRFEAFNITVIELDTSDVVEISQVSQRLLNDIRIDSKPRALILNTVRFGPHSKGDDTRDPERVAVLKNERDPIEICASHLDHARRMIIEKELDEEVQTAFEQALSDTSFRGSAEPMAVHKPLLVGKTESINHNHQTVLSALNTALHKSIAGDDRVILIGEDLLDPYGGAFKVAQGLSTAFSDQVLCTPISEAGIIGVATGMALRNLRPVVELMFGDFITLAADQLINHIAKFRWMYNEQVRVPLVIRTPMGGRRGYGPTHSQTLEKFFLGVPGLHVLAPSAFGNPEALLTDAIQDENPVLFIENKLLYLVQPHNNISLAEFDYKQINLPDSYAPNYSLMLRGAPVPDLTIAAYGYMAELALTAIKQLAYEYEIFAELIVLTQLSPFDLTPLLASARRTRRLLAVEEGTFTLGWGAEVLARSVESLGTHLHQARRVAAKDSPIPASTVLEELMLPGVDDIISAAQTMIFDE